MREVTEEELKADEEFWNQDFFQESQNDEEYEESTGIITQSLRENCVQMC